MAVQAQSAIPQTPYQNDIRFAQTSGTGTINVGDWLAYSGQFVLATNSGHTAFWKSSGAGVAMDANPVTDQAGRSVLNSALLYMIEGVILASASFSGQPTLGIGAYPDATGSGVNAATGLTGVGATWNTGVVLHGSALSGTANAQQPNVATVIGSQDFANAGTGKLLLRVVALPPDVRG